MGAGATTPRDDTGAVRALSAAKAVPSTTRPRLPEEVEARLAPVEARAAARYSALELLRHRLRQLAAKLRAAALHDDGPAAAGPAAPAEPLVSQLDHLRTQVARPPR